MSHQLPVPPPPQGPFWRTLRESRHEKSGQGRKSAPNVDRTVPPAQPGPRRRTKSVPTPRPRTQSAGVQSRRPSRSGSQPSATDRSSSSELVLYGHKFPVLTKELTSRKRDFHFLPVAWDYYAYRMTDRDVEWRTADEIRQLFIADREAADDGTSAAVWEPVRSLGAGGFGEVTLWRRKTVNGEPAELVAVKDMELSHFFGDYISEGNLMRRLGALNGCVNVCGVVDFAVVGQNRARLILEFCDLGSLWSLEVDYCAANLCFPEPFLWHLYTSLAKAICFCKYGSDDGTTKSGWEEIVHSDIKPANGLAFTVPNTEVRLYKSIFFHLGGETGRIPELRNEPLDSAARERRRRNPVRFMYERLGDMRVPGSHSDIFSVGCLMGRLIMQMDKRMPQGLKRRFRQRSRPHGHLYSWQLIQALDVCLLTYPGDRPDPYHLAHQTAGGMAEWVDRLTGVGFEGGELFFVPSRNAAVTNTVEQYRRSMERWIRKRIVEIIAEKPWRHYHWPSPPEQLVELDFLHTDPQERGYLDVPAEYSNAGSSDDD
ncbi:MAG: hypothetical protein M1826_005012 [Phylliscum demangeonii]|nr:MAG: hypothetical protein M1826_005012 [Phylliscum demangeonii]